MDVRLIVNPTATGVTTAVREGVVAALAPVCDLDVVLTHGPGEAVGLAAAREHGAIVSLGGDGTINEVMNGVREGVWVGTLPAGATSVYPRQLGFPVDAVEAAGILAASIRAGHTRRVGLGELDGRRFTFAAGLGLDADATAAVDRMRRERAGRARPGDWHVLAAAVGVLREEGFTLHERMTVATPDAPPQRASYVAVANQHPYTYFGRLPVRATPHAGFEHRLDVVFARELRRRDLWRLPVYALVYPRHARHGSSRIGYLHDVGELTITCDVPTALQVDGEYLGDVEQVHIRYLPGAVTVLVPAGREGPAAPAV